MKITFVENITTKHPDKCDFTACKNMMVLAAAS